MLIAWVVVLIGLGGLVLYAVTANPKLQEIGRIMFFAGLLVTCFLLGGKATRIGQDLGGAKAAAAALAG